MPSAAAQVCQAATVCCAAAGQVSRPRVAVSAATRRPELHPITLLGMNDVPTLCLIRTTGHCIAEVSCGTENVRVVERLTRVGPATIQYEVTNDDPATWAQPWTPVISLKRSEEPTFEYACHEGNYGMEGTSQALVPRRRRLLNSRKRLGRAPGTGRPTAG